MPGFAAKSCFVTFSTLALSRARPPSTTGVTEGTGPARFKESNDFDILEPVSTRINRAYGT